MEENKLKNENLLRNILSTLVLTIFIILELLYLNIIPNKIFNGDFKINFSNPSQQIIATLSEIESETSKDIEIVDSNLKQLDNSNKNQDSNEISFNGNYKIATVSEAYFDNALFVGDSRMLGFSIYKQILGATYYCYQSADAFTILDKEYELQPYGMMNL